MKLPEIVYGNVEGLGRYGSKLPSIIQKTGEVESNAVLEAGHEAATGIQKSSQILGQSITQAGSYAAKGILAAETKRNDTIARNQKERFALEISKETRLTNAWIGVAESFAQLAVKEWATNKGRAEEAEISSRTTSASTHANNVHNFVTSKDKVDINNPLVAEYASGYTGDFIEAIDPNTGRTMKMVDTYKVATPIMKAALDDISSKATEGLDPAASARMMSNMSVLEGSSMTKTFAKARSSFNRVIKQQTMSTIDTDIHGGNFELASKHIDAGEAVGNLSVSEASAYRTKVSDVKEADGFARGIETFDIQNGVVPTKAISSFREEIRNSQNPEKKSLISSLNTKENRLKANAKNYEAKVKAKRAFRIGTEAIADMHGSLTEEELSRTGGRSSSELISSVVSAAEARGLEGRELSQVRSAATASLNNARADYAAHINAAANDWWKRFEEDKGFIEPPITVPGMGAQTIRSQNKAWEARMNGLDISTDMNTYTKLREIEQDNPKNFPTVKELNLNYRGLLSEQAYKEMVNISNSLRKDPVGAKLKDADTNRLYNQFAELNYGKDWKKSKTKSKEAAGMRYAMDSMLWQMEGATRQEKRDAITELFSTKDVIFSKSWGDSYNDKKIKTIAESDIEQHMPKIIRSLEAEGAAITGQSIIKTFNYMVDKKEITF